MKNMIKAEETHTMKNIPGNGKSSHGQVSQALIQAMQVVITEAWG